MRADGQLWAAWFYKTFGHALHSCAEAVC